MASIRCAHCKQTHASVEDVFNCAQHEQQMKWEAADAKAEYEAERAAERFWEEGTAAQQDQYRWEVEQDERNAAFWSGAGL
jgi:hypothetical protein